MIKNITLVAIAVFASASLLNGQSYHHNDTLPFQEEIRNKTFQEIFVESVVYSNDYVTNYRVANDAAVYAAKALREVSAKTSIPFDNLQLIFEITVLSGGAKFAASAKDLVNLTQSFALAIQAAQKGRAGGRNVVFELPRLLAGTEAPTSKILKAWRLTRAEWNETLKYGRKDKDLADLVSAYDFRLPQ